MPAPFERPAAAIVIRVRPNDTLAYSLPVWLICRGANLAVSLQEEGPAQPRMPAPCRHLQPSCVVGGIEVSQLMAVVETVHELWPQAGVWPGELVARARARDACAGIVALCNGVSPFLLSLPSANVCADPELAQRVRASMSQGGSGTPLARCSVTAMAVLAELLAVRGLLDRPASDRVQALLGGKAASDWMTQPAVRRRMLLGPWRQGLVQGAMHGFSRE
jgi:hypothetical protein